jgi:uncharacterized protein YbcC (UPF0753/DUF2309 family)
MSATDLDTTGSDHTAPGTPSAVDRARLVADVARAGTIVAPYWPITAFIAVNPLGGLIDLPFDAATAEARRWFGARTHLPLAAFRAEHERGMVSDADLDRAIRRHLHEQLDGEVDELDDARAVDVLRRDLLHGPLSFGVGSATTGSTTAGTEQGSAVAALDDLVGTWCAAFVDEAHVPWAMPDRHLGFYRAWRAVAASDRRLAELVGRSARRQIADLPDDPVAMLALALGARNVDDDGRVAAIRAWLLRTSGWAGFARWCDDWAPVDRTGPKLRTVDLVAVRAAMDHLAGGQLDLAEPSAAEDDAELLQQRIDAAMATFAADGINDDVRGVVGRLLQATPESARSAIWLSAHEWSFRDRLLARLAPSAVDVQSAISGTNDRAAAPARADAQVVFCIDVRSEGFRRQLEALGNYETFGFAGFFGVPVRWRPLGSEVAQARCPVLVTPQHEIVEVAVGDERPYLSACSATAGLHDAFHAAKGGIASPFALAESAGWFAGPNAALRTLVPPHAPTEPGRSDGGRRRSWWRRAPRTPRTAPMVDAVAAGELHAGLSLDERTLFAEAILLTIGLADFAPIVVLCGHASLTVNNPHASSLDCGACGGAPGGASARIACAILNDADVRAELVHRGVEIPDDTWFVAAEHDTAADTVTMFDGDTLPAHLAALAGALQRDLDVAGERNARHRATRLPGSTARVRDRGHDWAQVRPEWGLAGNGAFIIGPRSITAEHDLASRAFLHSYVAERDPDGVALETIMTAPLVVAQWISSQYYFSTVEPDLFGAGDKMLHNPVGGIGVVIGESGDLAVGLPMQSVMLGEQRAHDPLRLMAVVQAPLERIADIIDRNEVLRQLLHGEWIHLVARATEHDAWSRYTTTGSWAPWHLADTADTVSELAHADLSIPLST